MGAGELEEGVHLAGLLGGAVAIAAIFARGGRGGVAEMVGAGGVVEGAEARVAQELRGRGLRHADAGDELGKRERRTEGPSEWRRMGEVGSSVLDDFLRSRPLALFLQLMLLLLLLLLLLQDSELDDAMQLRLICACGPGASIEAGGDFLVLGNVADILDDAEVDRAGGQAEGVSVGGKGVEEDVGGGVVCLARLPNHAGDAGEESEEGEASASCLRDLVEVLGPFDFGSCRGVEVLSAHRG